MKLRISFDFDSTLSLKKIKQMVGAFDRELVDLFIVTSRHRKRNNSDLWEVVELMGLDEDKVFMTDDNHKWFTLNELKISIHFDDMVDEIMLIQSRCENTLGILVTKDIIGDMNYLSLLQHEESKHVDNKNFE